MATVKNLVDISHHIAKEKGWWDDARNDGELIALMHSELSEALDGQEEASGCRHPP